MKAPFPWFGGKSRAAHLVWGAFGDVANYVEPFAGSLAVLLARPHAPRVETVNDLDCYLANFWRATKNAPAEVASWADWPVNEADLHARHRWLVGQEEFRLRLPARPDLLRREDRWLVGLGDLPVDRIGLVHESGMDGAGERGASSAGRQIPLIRQFGRTCTPGMACTAESATCPAPLAGRSARTSARADRVRRAPTPQRLASLASTSARRCRRICWLGCIRDAVPRSVSQLGGDSGAANRGIHATGKPVEAIEEWMLALADRLRRVRVCCGDWRRVLGRSATECIGVTAIMLDPPYGAAAGRDPSLYAEESLSVAQDVREWALEHGSNKKLRIALCGYEGEHEMPKSWQCVEWKAGGGYAGAAGHTENAARERIWFSPHCERAHDQAQLFAVGANR